MKQPINGITVTVAEYYRPVVIVFRDDGLVELDRRYVVTPAAYRARAAGASFSELRRAMV